MNLQIPRMQSLFGINIPTIDGSLRFTAESHNFNTISVSIICYDNV